MDFSQYIILPDTGMISRFAVMDDLDHSKAEEKWDWLIGECERHIPNFEGDYHLVNSPIVNLERINYGSFIKKLTLSQKDKMKSYFPLPARLFSNLENLSDPYNAAVFLDEKIKDIIESLKGFFSEIIKPNEIIQKSVDWRKNYPCHQYASIVCRELENWESALNEGDKGFAFQELLRHIALYVLFDHDWLIGKNLKVDRFEDLCEHERTIAFRLLSSYISQLHGGGNLSGSLLFSRLVRMGKNGFPKSQKELDGRPRLFKPYRELLDQYLAEYLCTGYARNNQRFPVIGITCDKKHQRDRIQRNIMGIQSVNEILDHLQETKGNEIPPKIPFHPGILLIIDQNQVEPSKIIDVKTFCHKQ